MNKKYTPQDIRKIPIEKADILKRWEKVWEWHKKTETQNKR